MLVAAGASSQQPPLALKQVGQQLFLIFDLRFILDVFLNAPTSWNIHLNFKALLFFVFFCFFFVEMRSPVTEFFLFCKAAY